LVKRKRGINENIKFNWEFYKTAALPLSYTSKDKNGNKNLGTRCDIVQESLLKIKLPEK